MPYTIDADWRANGNTNGVTNPRAGYCIHHAAGTSLDMAGTFLAAGTSAHYGIKDGKVRQFLEDGKSAWAAGDNWANNNLIHIECVNSGGAPDWPVSEETVSTLCEFLADKMRERGETKLVVGQNLYGHKDFFNTFCPGALYDRLEEIAERVNNLLNGDEFDMATLEDLRTVVREEVNENVLGNGLWSEDAMNRMYEEIMRDDDPTGRNVNLKNHDHIKWIAAKQADMDAKLDKIIEALGK